MHNNEKLNPSDKEHREKAHFKAEFISNGANFRRIVEKIQDIIFVNDSRGNFLYMNPAGFRLLGYSPEELYQMNYVDIFPDEYKDRAYEFYSGQLKDKLEKTYQDLPILCRDKSLLWFGLNVIRVEDNQEIFFCGMARDITDRLKMEEALRESEEKYRTILETMDEGYYEVDLAGNFIYFNKAMYKLFGSNDINDFRLTNYTEVMDIQNARHVFREFNQVFTTGISKEVKYTLSGKDNAERKLEALVSPIINRENRIIGFRGIARDVTEREKILEDLKNSLAETELSEKKYRLIAENSTDIIWVINLDPLKFSYLSPALEKVRGVSVEEGLEEKLDSVFPPEDLTRILTLLGEELQKEKAGTYPPDRRMTFESQQYRKDRSLIWVEITAKFIRDENGEISAIQGTTRDVSHRKQVEQERDRFAENIAAARLVQQEILPQTPPSSELVDIAFRYLPLEQVGGDYFTFIDFREHNSLGLFIGDVSGHGVPAALYTMMVKAITDRLFRKYSLNPPRFLEELNNEVYAAMSKHFLTGIYGLFSYGDKTDTVNLNFSKGGHPYPVYYNPENKTAEYLESTGKALGFFENEKFPNTNITLKKGDRVYFYTDGLIEVTDKDHLIFGFDRFLNLIREANSENQPLDKSLNFILKRVIDFNPQYEQEDDIILIGLEIR